MTFLLIYFLLGFIQGIIILQLILNTNYLSKYDSIINSFKKLVEKDFSIGLQFIFLYTIFWLFLWFYAIYKIINDPDNYEDDDEDENEK